MKVERLYAGYQGAEVIDFEPHRRHMFDVEGDFSIELIDLFRTPAQIPAELGQGSRRRGSRGALLRL